MSGLVNVNQSANVEAMQEEEEVVPPAAEFIEIGTDGEETEYAEYTIEELQQQAAVLKAEIAGLVDAVNDPDIVSTEWPVPPYFLEFIGVIVECILPYVQ